jgi:hypothetical protein
MDTRVLKGSKKTNAERAKHRARATSALSRYTRRNPTAKKPAAPVNQMDTFTLGLILNGIRERKQTREGALEAPYPKTHIPKRAPVRNTTIARERAQRVANQMTRRLNKRKPSGVSSRAEARRSLSISQRRISKEAKRASESATQRQKAHAARKRVEHMSIVPEESHSASHSNDFFDRT